MKAKMREARLVSDMASLEERVKETEKVHIEFHDGAPHFASKDGNFTFAVNGRAQVGSQYNFINEVAPPTGNNRQTNGTAVRHFAVPALVLKARFSRSGITNSSTTSVGAMVR